MRKEKRVLKNYRRLEAGKTEKKNSAACSEEDGFVGGATHTAQSITRERIRYRLTHTHMSSGCVRTADVRG